MSPEYSDRLVAIAGIDMDIPQNLFRYSCGIPPEIGLPFDEISLILIESHHIDMGDLTSDAFFVDGWGDDKYVLLPSSITQAGRNLASWDRGFRVVTQALNIYPERKLQTILTVEENSKPQYSQGFENVKVWNPEIQHFEYVEHFLQLEIDGGLVVLPSSVSEKGGEKGEIAIFPSECLVSEDKNDLSVMWDKARGLI